MKQKSSLQGDKRSPFFGRVVQLIVAVVCLFLLAPVAARAQANAGVTGTVTDSSGAVIPDVKVTITNVGTTTASHLVTSSAGTYAINGLNPGKYTITAEATGFKKAVHNDVTIDVSVTSTIDITMVAGALDETVEIDASQIALNTTQPQMGSTIEPVVVAALPVQVAGRGRQVDSLQFLAPGTTGDTFSHRIGGGVDFEQEIVYNGIPVAQPETEGYTTNFNPPFEMVQEFRVERSTFGAQFGLGLGALTYQMKSGTNNYHGDLFYINRNSFFDSVGFFNGPSWNKANVDNKPPSDHENNYGFSVGGPLSIPHVYNGKNKTFGHYSQEWFKQNNENIHSTTVPTVLQKQGNFTDFVGSDGNLIPIFDPTTGQQFQCNGVLNVICPDRISPLSQTMLPYVPDPDRPGTGGGGLDNNKSYVPFINPNDQNVWGFTIEQILTQSQTLKFSMWHNSFHNFGFDGDRTMALPPNPVNSLRDFPAKGSGYLLTYTNAMTPNLAMTAGFGWIGEINNQFNNTSYNFPGVADGIIPPSFEFDGQHTLSKWGTDGSNTGSVNRKLGIAIVNNWVWTHGRHTFNIGAEFRRSYQDDNEEQHAGGHFIFSQRTTSTPGDHFNDYGSAFASYLLGIPDSDDRANSQEERLRNLDFSPYIQDDIKLTPKLTVNLGVRWDIQVPFTENNNQIVYLNPTGTDAHYADAGGNPIAGAATKFGYCPGCANYTRALTHFSHVGPRIGFAYKLSEKSVLQAGFAIAFLNGGAYEYGTNKVAVNNGNLLVGTYTRTSTGNQSSAVGQWDLPGGAPILPNPPATPFSTALGAGTQIMAFSKDDGYAPYAQQWNVNYQRELPFNMFFSAAWVGNRVIHLPSQLNQINQLDPKYLSLGNELGLSFADGSAQAAGFALPYTNFVNDFGGSATVAQSLTPYPQYSKVFNNFEGSGTTYYQGAQFELDRRFSNGLAFLVGFTLSHLMDNTSSGFSSFANGGINKYNQKPEYVVSSSDEPRTLKVSGTYELPIGPGKKYLSSRGVAGQILGGWQLGWILRYEAGTAFGVTQNGQPFPNGFYRPLRNSNVKLSTKNYNVARDQFISGTTGNHVFDPLAFSQSPDFVLADTARNFSELRNPAVYNENANVRKKFFFGERFTGTFTLDYFNLLNRTIFNGPEQNINNSNFGQVTNQSLQTSNRQGQLGFTLEF